MTNKEYIVNRIRQLTNKEYIPKFKVGDTIMNPQYKIASIILNLELQESPNHPKPIWWYITRDVYNPGKSKHNLKYQNSKAAYKVDMYYEKVNPNAIEVLFGGN